MDTTTPAPDCAAVRDRFADAVREAGIAVDVYDSDLSARRNFRAANLLDVTVYPKERQFSAALTGEIVVSASVSFGYRNRVRDVGAVFSPDDADGEAKARAAVVKAAQKAAALRAELDAEAERRRESDNRFAALRAAAKVRADAINAGLPDDAPVRAAVDRRGGVILETRGMLDEAQIARIVAVFKVRSEVQS